MKKYSFLICFLWITATAAAAQKPVATIPFDFYGNLPYLKAGVNGSKTVWFVLDSGASGCVIDKTWAGELGLKTEGKAAGTGAGKGTYEITYAKDATYDMPGTKLKVDSSYVIDLSSNHSQMGRPLHGIIGYDFFKRYVVLIDYEKHVIKLYEPATFNYTGTGETVPIVLKPKTPHFTGKLKVAGREAADREFLIDSGSGDAVDDDLIAESTAPKREIVAGVGLGQEFRSVMGPVEWLKMGKLSVENTFGVSGGKALIGGQVLKRFTVILDYSRNQMILEPNRFYSDVFTQDASGADLRLDTATKYFKVHSVQKNTAAEEAGLKEGDLITAIDGHPSSAFELARVWDLFSKAGRVHRLSLLRDKNKLKITIRLHKKM